MPRSLNPGNKIIRRPNARKSIERIGRELQVLLAGAPHDKTVGGESKVALGGWTRWNLRLLLELYRE